MGTNKTLYGILAFGPIALMIVGLIGIFGAAMGASRYSHEPPLIFFLMLILIFIGSILSLVSLIMYIIHISKNRALDDGTRVGWIVGMIFAHGIASIVYFFVHIVNEQPAPPQEPFGNPKNPW